MRSPRRSRRRFAVAALLGTLAVPPRDARAADPPRRLDLGPGVAPRRDLRGLGTYAQLLAAVAVGRGLRLNNPFRLPTALGDDAESASLTATWADVALGAALGDPEGLQHGGVVHWSIATDGIPQQVLSPGYLLAWRPSAALLTTARASVPVVLFPDANAGGEVAAGVSWFFRAGAALTAELGYAVFYGAATPEVSPTMVPIAFVQLGVLAAYEVLP